MALELVRCSIEGDQGGTLYARARVSWEGGSHGVLFTVLLSSPGARPMAQVLQLPFEYYIMYTSGVGISNIMMKFIVPPYNNTH